MKTYSEVARKRQLDLKNKIGAKEMSKRMRDLVNKRWSKCKCGHVFDVHDGACNADSCQCTCFRGVVNKVDN